jgi:hypothetical protein
MRLWITGVKAGVGNVGLPPDLAVHGDKGHLFLGDVEAPENLPDGELPEVE